MLVSGRVMAIWMFPTIMVPPNDPFLIGFSIINHSFWGTPIFGNTQMVIPPLKKITAFPHHWEFLGLKVPEVISLDKRCYSCCSQTQMVMSGFKFGGPGNLETQKMAGSEGSYGGFLNKVYGPLMSCCSRSVGDL